MTSKQRAALRGMAQALEPILHIGKDGINDNIVKQCNDALEARELIKAEVQQNSPISAKQACEYLCEELNADAVQVIGRRFVMFRASRKNPRIELGELC